MIDRRLRNVKSSTSYAQPLARRKRLAPTKTYIQVEVKPRMRIAQISPLFEAVPPRLYGGTERVVYSLTEELVAMGHDVTLFASGDSITSARLAPMREQALRLDPSVGDWIATYKRVMGLIYPPAEQIHVVH